MASIFVFQNHIFIIFYKLHLLRELVHHFSIFFFSSIMRFDAQIKLIVSCREFSGLSFGIFSFL